MSKVGKGQTCAYCRRTLEAMGAQSRVAATRDHVVPKSMGGRHAVWCCRQCNGLKANMLPEQWAEFMRQNPEWWRTFRYGIPLRERAKYFVPP